MNENVLVTGGLGFIGSNIAQKLVALGAKVTIVDACLNPYGWNFANISEIRNKVKFVKGDIRNFKLMNKLVKGKDIIFDCAAQVSHTLSVKDPFLDVDINCKGPITILEAVRKAGTKPKIVYAGTRGEVGRMIYSPIDENHPTNPVDMNGINKLAAEKYYLLYNKLYEIPATSVRINNTYGERSMVKTGDYSIVNYFVRRALLNEQISIYGPGTQTRDFGYVQDVADAMVLAAQSDKANGEIFMLGTGKETRLVDMLKLILKTVGSTMEIKHLPWPEERKSIEIGNFVVTFKKIKKFLGWEPKTSMQQGIKNTVDFYRERIREYL
jgi:nucleoside-diphosphate-sugar epimerase